jgi:hypothetical protein
MNFNLDVTLDLLQVSSSRTSSGPFNHRPFPSSQKPANRVNTASFKISPFPSITICLLQILPLIQPLTRTISLAPGELLTLSVPLFVIYLLDPKPPHETSLKHTGRSLFYHLNGPPLSSGSLMDNFAWIPVRPLAWGPQQGHMGTWLIVAWIYCEPRVSAPLQSGLTIIFFFRIRREFLDRYNALRRALHIQLSLAGHRQTGG